MSKQSIEIHSLSYRYPDGTDALRDITLTIPLHQRTVILGANGCGKSTLLRHLNGLLLPQSGSITISDIPLTAKTADKLRRSVGLLFDNPDNQLFSPTVESDVSFGPSNLRMSKEEIQRRTQMALETVEITGLREKSPYNLSLGQKKRCAIAGILAMEPEIMLMDEPFSGLDPAALKQFLRTLDTLSARGVSQIMSTHDVDLAYDWAEYVIVIQKGGVLAVGDRSLMQDQSLMERANLTRPMLVRLFDGLGPVPVGFNGARQTLKALLSPQSQS